MIEYRRRVAASADKDPHVIVHIRLPDGSIYPHPGLTNFLDVQVQTDTDTVTARAQLPNPDGVLIPGGIVGVIVERGKPRSALLVPQSAVLLDQAGHYVMVVDDAKKVEQRRITTGSEQGRNIEVENGLKEGELVIVDGIQKVRPGQVVIGDRRARKLTPMFSEYFHRPAAVRHRHRHRHHAGRRSSRSPRYRSRSFPTSCRRRSR